MPAALLMLIRLLCLHARHVCIRLVKPLSNALCRLPNLCLHQIQKKTVGGRQLCIFTWSEHRLFFFSKLFEERTIRYSLYNVHKTKPTQNPCWREETTSLAVCTALPPGTSSGSPAPPTLQHQHQVKVLTKWCNCADGSKCVHCFSRVQHDLDGRGHALECICLSVSIQAYCYVYPFFIPKKRKKLC